MAIRGFGDQSKCTRHTQLKHVACNILQCALGRASRADRGGRAAKVVVIVLLSWRPVLSQCGVTRLDLCAVPVVLRAGAVQLHRCVQHRSTSQARKPIGWQASVQACCPTIRGHSVAHLDKQHPVGVALPLPHSAPTWQRVKQRHDEGESDEGKKTRN